ncbi:rhomboid family intramembrane serine protease [Tahibacter amnicola]|uniref:Rhomboid family intramembrane serine protease n=1 Tax=Tahibacter amnicola TaxID=2976241 RepID=A0ABY6BEC5_9GAMM|nr:rhomboid family intramembrane serine protease [Tahibacter amnicola]UXI68393.1 rhomboid family intramembrane serine protease [Tahibacter amnicola]
MPALRPNLATMDTAAAPLRDTPQLKRAAWIAFGFVALLWLIKFIELGSTGSFSWLGVRPREWEGLLGVLTAPLVHGSFEHLFMNSMPLFVLLTLALFQYPRGSRRAIPWIWLVGGLGLWVIGRASWHIGASGLTHGLMFFLFGMGLLRRDRGATVIAMVVFFLYGSMVVTILPREAGVSWEAHLGGAFAGILAAFFWQRLDPAAAEPKPSWELEEENATAPDETYEPPRPDHVPVIWHRTETPRGVVIHFPVRRRRDDGESLH